MDESGRFPQLIVHAGNHGYIASVRFNEADLLDSTRWASKTETLRKNLVKMEKMYRKVAGGPMLRFDLR